MNICDIKLNKGSAAAHVFQGQEGNFLTPLEELLLIHTQGNWAADSVVDFCCRTVHSRNFKLLDPVIWLCFPLPDLLYLLSQNRHSEVLCFSLVLFFREICIGACCLKLSPCAVQFPCHDREIGTRESLKSFQPKSFYEFM